MRVQLTVGTSKPQTALGILLVIVVLGCATTPPPSPPPYPVLRYQGNDGRWHEATPAVTKPILQTHIAPEWPVELRTDRNTGVVALNALIDREGAVQDVVVIHSVTKPMDDVAVRTVRQWHYTPAIFEAAPVAVWYYVTVTFRLN